MAVDRITRRTLLGGTAALAVAALAACNGTSPTAPAQKRILNVGATLEPPTLDPTISAAASIPQILLYNVYETLVKMDGEGHLKPLLAQRWDVSDDGKEYTFFLDRGAHFASGAPVDAKAVVAGIERMRKSTVASIKDQLAVIETVAEGEGGSVVVTLTRPSNLWLYGMASTAGMIIDPAATELATAPAGSGPFVYTSWTKGDRIVLTKNAKYWGTPGRFDEVDFRYYIEANAMVAAMLAGDLDIVSNLQSPQSLDQFKDASRFTILDGNTTGEVVLGFNHTTPALANLKVRQAINYAIDRKALIDTVWGGHGRLIGSMASPTEPYYEDLSNAYPYNPDKARQLLAEAGTPTLNLRLRIPITPYATSSARFVAGQLSQVGITATIEELDFAGRWLPEVFTKGDYDMTIVAHVEPFDIVRWADPSYYWHYNNPAFTALVTEADQANSEEFVATMKKAAKMLSDDAVADFLFMLPNLIVTKSTISGLSPNMTSLSFDLTTIASSR